MTNAFPRPDLLKSNGTVHTEGSPGMSLQAYFVAQIAPVVVQELLRDYRGEGGTMADLDVEEAVSLSLLIGRRLAAEVS